MKLFTAAIAIPFFFTLFLGGCARRDLSTGPTPLGWDERKGKVLLGPVLGLARNYHSGGFRTFSEPQCGIFGEGSGLGPIVGVAAEYLPSETMGIAARVSFDQRPGRFHQELQDAYVIGTAGGNPLLQRVSMSSQVMYGLLNVDLLVKQEFAYIGGTRFGVAAGPSFGLVASGTQKQTLDLIEPLEARFVNENNLPSELGGRRLILYDGAIQSRRSFRASVMTGLQAEIPVFDQSWMVIPSVYYDYAVTDVTGSENWRLNSVVAMVDFRHAF